MLADVLMRLENLEALMGVTRLPRLDPADDIDDPTGFDAGRRP